MKYDVFDFDDADGPDLEKISNAFALSNHELINRHNQTDHNDLIDHTLLKLSLRLTTSTMRTLLDSHSEAMAEEDDEYKMLTNTTLTGFMNAHQLQQQRQLGSPDALSTLFFIVVYSLLGVLSLTGNMTIIIVISRRKRMRTVTNYFLGNITLANILYTLCVPFQMINFIQNRYVLISLTCPGLPVLSTMFINVNTFSMVAASLDQLIVITRYELICHTCFKINL
jgi:hypothetical protein